MRPRPSAIVTLVAIVVGLYYWWGIGVTGRDFEWNRDLDGYYDLLGRAFAHGELALPVLPRQELLAYPDPTDPQVDRSLRMHDLVLYRKRYYLYHGAGPAVLLFAPWRLVTGHDLPEHFALWVFCFGGFLFSCGTLLRLLELGGGRPRTRLLATLLLALGLCQGTPFLLNRVWVYEIAIGGGYFCLSAAFFFLVRGVGAKHRLTVLAASGLMFGLAISCRPHLALAGAAAFAAVLWLRQPKRDWIALGVPMVLAGLAVAGYNYARFGDPFEFGIRYLLTGTGQNRVKLSATFLPPGLYYFLLAPPDLSLVFPWVRLLIRFPFGSPHYPLPGDYFLEPIAGALWLVPFAAAAAWFPPRTGRVRILLWTLLAAAVTILLFDAATGWSTQRYEVDFLPLFVLVAAANLAIRISEMEGWKRTTCRALVGVAVFYSVVANLAIAITGPYDQFLQNRPESYLRLANWFSPVERYRPMWNPKIDIQFRAEFVPEPDGYCEPLVTIGSGSHRHFIYSERVNRGIRVTSKAEDSSNSYDLKTDGLPTIAMGVTYSPETQNFGVTVDGKQIITHHVEMVVTAREQITVGENRISVVVTEEKFAGRISGIALMY